MSLSTIRKELQELAVQQGMSLPVPPPRDRGAPRPVAKLPSGLRIAAQEAIAGYRASEDYRDLIASRATLDLAGLQARCAAALQGPHFAALKARLRDPARLDIDPEDFIPKAISFGLLAQFVLIVGISGSVGFVENVDMKNNPQSAVYGGGAFDVGIDAGIEGDVCVGFWTNEVSDISGLYVGGEVDVDDGIGMTVATFLKDEDPALAFVGVDLGVDDGIEEENFYFFHIDVGSHPIYQPGEATYLIQLLWLECTNSKDNYDTVKFTFQQDTDSDGPDVTFHFPAWDGFQMAESGNDPNVYKWNVGAILKFNTNLVLTLQVGDYTMPSLTISASDFSGVFKVISPPAFDAKDGIDEITYTLTYQFIKG